LKLLALQRNGKYTAQLCHHCNALDLKAARKLMLCSNLPSVAVPTMSRQHVQRAHPAVSALAQLYCYAGAAGAATAADSGHMQSCNKHTAACELACYTELVE
jgi:hypothetical protein